MKIPVIVYSSVFAANASKPGAPSTKCPVPIVIAPLGDGCAYDDEQEDNCHSVPPSHASLSQEHMDSVEVLYPECHISYNTCTCNKFVIQWVVL